MGTCKTNCCAERFVSYSLEDNTVETNARPTNREIKPKKSGRGQIIEEEEELSTAQNKYNELTIQIAGFLFKQELYENVTKGSSFDDLIMPEISDQKNIVIYLLLDYVFETISNFSVSDDDQFSSKLISYFKLSLKKKFVELNQTKTFSESSSIKQPLVDALMNMVEIYHFFRYNQNKARRVKNPFYSENYWKNVTDTNNHFKKSIFATVDKLTQINKVVNEKTKAGDSYDDKTPISNKMMSANNFLNSVLLKI